MWKKYANSKILKMCQDFRPGIRGGTTYNIMSYNQQINKRFDYR